MADETKTSVDAAADSAKATIEAAGDAAKQAASTTAKVNKTQAQAAGKAAASASKVSKRRAKSAASETKKTPRRSKVQRKTRRTARPAVAVAAKERTNTVNFDPNNWFAQFGAVPVAAPFQSLFADAGERSQEAVRRSQKAAEELADLTRANVEALVDAGRIAVEGARSLGHGVVETSREGIEQTADAVRALAEAKSPTEFIQLQGEFARASFDRFVTESSRFTESVVKLAGEAFQPLSNRASVNAERLNKFVA